MQNEAIFTLTTAQLMTYITIVNVVLILVVAIFGTLAYYLVNRRITRLNRRISDTHNDVANRSIALAHSFSDLAHTMFKDRRPPDLPTDIPQAPTSDTVVPMTPPMDRRT